MTQLSRKARFGLTLALCFGAIGAGHAQETVAPQGPPGNWNDTSIGFRYAQDLYFPGSDQKVTQKIGVLNAVGGFKYGSYAFNVDYLVSDKNNPEAGGTSGAQEVYSVGRVDFSAGRVFGQPVGIPGVVRDIGLTTGYEFSSKDDAFANRARMLVIGPSAQIAVPRGFWNVMVGWRSENNYNGIVHKDVHYDIAPHAESSWAIPFGLGPVPMVFKGFLSATAPKGLDGFHVQTKPEVLTRMSFLFDVGALAGHPRTFLFGPGYEYWNNMFGTPSSETPGTHRSALTLVGEVHF